MMVSHMALNLLNVALGLLVVKNYLYKETTF